MFQRFLKHLLQSLSRTFHLFGGAHNDQLNFRQAANSVNLQPAYLQPLASHFGGYDMAEKIQASLSNYHR